MVVKEVARNLKRQSAVRSYIMAHHETLSGQNDGSSGSNLPSGSWGPAKETAFFFPSHPRLRPFSDRQPNWIQATLATRPVGYMIVHIMKLVYTVDGTDS